MSTLACSACAKRDAPSYFKVTRVSPSGAEEPITVTCSVRCLLAWGYQFTALQSAKMVYSVKQVLGQLFAPRVK